MLCVPAYPRACQALPPPAEKRRPPASRLCPRPRRQGEHQVPLPSSPRTSCATGKDGEATPAPAWGHPGIRLRPSAPRRREMGQRRAGGRRAGGSSLPPSPPPSAPARCRRRQRAAGRAAPAARRSRQGRAAGRRGGRGAPRVTPAPHPHPRSPAARFPALPRAPGSWSWARAGRDRRTAPPPTPWSTVAAEASAAGKRSEPERSVTAGAQVPQLRGRTHEGGCRARRRGPQRLHPPGLRCPAPLHPARPRPRPGSGAANPKMAAGAPSSHPCADAKKLTQWFD